MAAQPIELIHTPDYQQIKQNFLSELTLASAGKPSSLSFIKHKLPQHPILTKGIVQGIVIGGTNFILSTEALQPDGTREILDRKIGVLPIFDTKKIFVDFLFEHIDPRAEAIGINFGFPLQPLAGSNGEIDGKLVRGTKEHAFKGLHEPIGELVKSLYQKKYQKDSKVSIANDTICLTLSGDGSENGAFVAGTGFNMCLVLHEKIKKTLINLESGNFNKFSQSPILQKIDAKSEKPGAQLIEKSISGKYLALYFNEKIKELHLPISPITTSQELSELSHRNHPDVERNLARAIIERSAFLVGAAIAGIYEFNGKPPTFNLNGEGSLLWHGWYYQANIQKQLLALGIPANTIIIKHIKDSSINGAIGLITQPVL